ncbi:MAG: NTP transferase domain-containing protein [Caulobacteraceae bacterium]|nr:NTP transferase domain-containing protein [Caulobacteraceae bacterium]
MKGAAKGMRAVILAGGKGTRLKPFTVTFPKPLMPLGDIPVVEVLVRRLVEFGITDVTLTLGHLADLIRAYFDRRQKLCSQLTFHYVQEDQPTGTAGSLSFVDGLDQTFLTMNGDLLTDLDFDALVAFHRREGAALTIATHARTIKIDLGVLEVGDDGRLTGYREKPELKYMVSMGVYVYEPRVLNYIEYGKYLDFPDLVLKLLAAGEKVCAWPWDGLWLDIGRPDDYARAQDLFANRPETFLADAPELV